MIEGVVQNGVVVLDQPSALPSGTRVRVESIVTSPAPKAGVWDDLVDLAEEVEKLPCDLPTDLAANHDHYLYGTPKRS